MLNIWYIPKKYIWRSNLFKKIVTLHTVTDFTANSVKNTFQKFCFFICFTNKFSEELSLKHLQEHILPMSK